MLREEGYIVIAQVKPVIDYSARSLCCRPYPGHPKGCPNYGKKPCCPPGAPLFDQVYDLSQPVYAIWNAFPIGEHAARMRALHPEWSDRQLYCCLYWQGTARKQLAKETLYFPVEFKLRHSSYVRAFGFRYEITACPEAMGINVTATMAGIGVDLEWPPRVVAYQVALAGIRKERE
jgi:hypothetical protein